MKAVARERRKIYDQKYEGYQETYQITLYNNSVGVKVAPFNHNQDLIKAILKTILACFMKQELP